jgi:hypothetical protein
MRWRPKINLSRSPGKQSFWRRINWAAIGMGANHVAQVGLLVVAIVVYVNTVIPVYQKSVLEEDIAKKTLELAGISSKLNAFAKQVGDSQRELAETHRHLSQARLRLEQTGDQLKAAGERLTIAVKEAETARRDGLKAREDLTASLSQLGEVKTKLVTANERARAVYVELRSIVASRAIADLSSSCSLSWGPFAIFVLKDEGSRPRSVKLNENILATCISRQVRSEGIGKQILKLTDADRTLLRNALDRAAKGATSEIAAILKTMHEKERKLREQYPKDSPVQLPELKDDELPINQTPIFNIAGTMSSGMVKKAIGDFGSLRQDWGPYAELSKKVIFQALDEFLKKTPIE